MTGKQLYSECRGAKAHFGVNSNWTAMRCTMFGDIPSMRFYSASAIVAPMQDCSPDSTASLGGYFLIVFRGLHHKAVFFAGSCPVAQPSGGGKTLGTSLPGCFSS